MKSKLERFVRDNREDFDREEPRIDLWNELERKLGHSPLAEEPVPAPLETAVPSAGRQLRLNWGAGSSQRIWRIAATVALIIGLGSGFLYLNQQYGVTSQPEVVAVSPAYAKSFAQYARLIDDKRTELRTLTSSNPALYEEFATELDQLERSYRNLKQELPKTPNQEVLIQAMVQNLQMQIDLLNQQLRIIQRIKQQTNEPQEAIL